MGGGRVGIWRRGTKSMHMFSIIILQHIKLKNPELNVAKVWKILAWGVQPLICKVLFEKKYDSIRGGGKMYNMEPYYF